MRINLKPMKTIYTLLYILSITCCSFGQGVKLAKADKKYEKYAYIDAIEIYEKLKIENRSVGATYYNLGITEKTLVNMEAATKYGRLAYNIYADSMVI